MSPGEIVLLSLLVSGAFIVLAATTSGRLRVRQRRFEHSVRSELSKRMEQMRKDFAREFDRFGDLVCNLERAGCALRSELEAAVADFHCVKQSLEALSSDLKGTISRITDRIETIHKAVHKLERDLSRFTRDVGGLQNELAQSARRLDNIELVIDAVRSHASKLASRPDDVERKLRSSHEDPGTYEKESGIPGTEKNIAEGDCDTDQEDRSAGAVRNGASNSDERISGKVHRPVETTDRTRLSSGQNVSETTGMTSGRRIPPENRGGRPRDPDRTKEQVEEVAYRVRRSRCPHVVARYGPDGWEFFIEIDAENTEDIHLVQATVTGEDPIDRVAAERNLFGPLPDLERPIFIQRNGQSQNVRSLIQLETPLLFKISRATARSVRHPGLGLHFIVVPESWEYNVEASGNPPLEPEPTAIPGYMVHYFRPERMASVTFRRPNGEPYTLGLPTLHYRLDGEIVHDGEENMGSLFVKGPPRLYADAGTARKVSKIVLGEEGGGSDRWRIGFSPDWQVGNGDAHCDLPSEFRSRGAGWYFLRLYDKEGDLLSSMDFRYIQELHKASVSHHSAANGPGEIEIAFLHESNLVIAPFETIAGGERDTQMSDGLQRTVFRLPCEPNVRQARFRLTVDGRDVRATFETDRPWWKLKNGEIETRSWRSAPIRINRKRFRATSDVRLCLRFPKSFATRGVRIDYGFTEENRRPLKRLSSEGLAELALREFSETPELHRLGWHAFRVWTTIEDRKCEYLTLCIINYAQCKWCQRRFCSDMELLEHALREHDAEIFTHLELRTENVNEMNLPKRVYVCMYCGKTYSEKPRPLTDAVSEIQYHCEKEHGKRPDFRAVNDISEIINILVRRVKDVWICRHASGCNYVVVESGTQNTIVQRKRRHLHDHLRDIYTVV